MSPCAQTRISACYSPNLQIKTLKQLQGVFAELAYGRFSSVDPHELVHDLVVPGEQQDIQEFASLFYDVIERGLQHHANVAARTALSDKVQPFSYFFSCLNECPCR